MERDGTEWNGSQMSDRIREVCRSRQPTRCAKHPSDQEVSVFDIGELQMLPEEEPAIQPDLEAVPAKWECTPLSCLYDFTGGLEARG